MQALQKAAPTCDETGRPRGTFDPAQMQRLFPLHETIVEMTQVAMLYEYRPLDSRQFHVDVIGWAIEWEAQFCQKADSGEWPEDEWIERTEDFTRAKLETVRDNCMRWRL